MTAPFLSVPIFQWPSAPGGLLNSYQAGSTSVLKNTYSDAAAANPNANPVVLDANGTATVRLEPGAYHFVLTDSTGSTTVWDADYYTAPYLTPEDVGSLINPQLQAEINANVIPITHAYAVGNLQRYGSANDGATDDTPAWLSMAAVAAQGVNCSVPPLPTLITSQVVFETPLVGSLTQSQRIKVEGYGCTIMTTGAIDAIRCTSFNSTGGYSFYGFTHANRDANCTGSFNAFGSLNTYFIECEVLLSSTVAPSASYFCFGIRQSDPTNAATGALWNKVIRCKTRQESGNPSAYAPFAVFIDGQSNANEVLNCTFSSTTYGVGIYNQISGGGAGVIPNAIRIYNNDFEGGSYAVIVNGQNNGTSHIEGLRIINNRGEALTSGWLLLQGIGADSNVFTRSRDNYMVSSVASYITQSNVGGLKVTVNSDDPGITPSFPEAITFSGAPSGSSVTLNVVYGGTGGYKPINFSDGEQIVGLFTNGSATVPLNSAISGSPTTAATIITSAKTAQTNNGPMLLSSIAGDALELKANSGSGLSLKSGTTFTGGIINRAGGGTAVLGGTLSSTLTPVNTPPGSATISSGTTVNVTVNELDTSFQFVITPKTLPAGFYYYTIVSKTQVTVTCGTSGTWSFAYEVRR